MELDLPLLLCLTVINTTRYFVISTPLNIMVYVHSFTFFQSSITGCKNGNFWFFSRLTWVSFILFTILFLVSPFLYFNLFLFFISCSYFHFDQGTPLLFLTGLKSVWLVLCFSSLCLMVISFPLSIVVTSKMSIIFLLL